MRAVAFFFVVVFLLFTACASLHIQPTDSTGTKVTKALARVPVAISSCLGVHQMRYSKTGAVVTSSCIPRIACTSVMEKPQRRPAAMHTVRSTVTRSTSTVRYRATPHTRRRRYSSGRSTDSFELTLPARSLSTLGAVSSASRRPTSH